MKLSIARLLAGVGTAKRVATPLCVAAMLFPSVAVHAQEPQVQVPIVITGADMRVATSLDGDWGAIVDPYFNGLFSFHHQIKSNGWFLNQKAKPGDPFPIEYNFATAPKLKVPGDWNTQRESLLYYEGPIWYERDFTYHRRNIQKSFSTSVRPITARGSG